MPFTINDMQELTEILTLHPEWRVNLRRLVLTDELLTLPAIVQELAKAQQRTEQRLNELAIAQKELVAAQQRTEQRINELVMAQRELVVAQQRTELSIADLTQNVQTLTKQMIKAETRVSKVDGLQLERTYVDRAAGYFGNWLRRVKVVWPGPLDETLEDQLETILTRDERNEVLRLDAIIRGKARTLTDQPEVYLAVEASIKIETKDVTHAYRRAELLRRLGLLVVPVVAGETIEGDAQGDAKRTAVVVLQNGSSDGWEAALAAALPAK